MRSFPCRTWMAIHRFKNAAVMAVRNMAMARTCLPSAAPRQPMVSANALVVTYVVPFLSKEVSQYAEICQYPLSILRILHIRGSI